LQLLLLFSRYEVLDAISVAHLPYRMALPSTASGLVYRHFGKEVVASILGWAADHPDLDTVYLQVYKASLGASRCSYCITGLNQQSIAQEESALNR
jgi:hypothetical protein